MPQLNPDPWLSVMLITWLFLLIVMTKIINIKQISTSKTQNTKTTKNAWPRPWR